MTLTDLVLFRCAELVPGDAPLFDADGVAEEARLATLALTSGLDAAALLAPAGLGIVRTAGADRLPVKAYAADDDDADPPLRGRLVVGLPEDFHRLVRVRLSGWGVPLDVALSADSGVERPVAPYGVGQRGAATAAVPEAFLRVHHFALEDFPAPPTDPGGPSPATGRLRLALVLGPGYEGETARTLADLYYLSSDPDPERLQGTLRDAVAWATTSRLLAQDGETRALADRADAMARDVMRTLPTRGATVVRRHGLLV